MKTELYINYLKTHYFAEKINLTDTVKYNDLCPLCESKTYKLTTIRNNIGDEVIIKNICPSCSYIYFSKLPKNKWIENFYSNIWDGARVSAKKQNVEESYKESFEIIDKYVEDKSIKMFDLGTGYGEFLTGCRNRGFEKLFGIENSIKRMKYCNHKLGLKVSHSTAERINEKNEILSNGPYDVIHSNAVFEHLYDINQAIINVKKILKNDGLIILVVPNVMNEHFLYIAQALPHIRNFTKFSMKVLLEKHGFEIIEMSNDDGNIKVVSKNKNIKNSHLPKLQKSEYLEIKEHLERKLLIDFNFNSEEKSYKFWSYGSSARIQTKSILKKKELLNWELKKYFVGINRREYPIRGNSVSYLKSLQFKNIGMKLSRLMQNYHKIELSGYCDMSLSQDITTEKKPLLELIYPFKQGVVFLK